MYIVSVLLITEIITVILKLKFYVPGVTTHIMYSDQYLLFAYFVIAYGQCQLAMAAVIAISIATELAHNAYSS